MAAERFASAACTRGVDNFTPFAFGDFTWLNGSPRNKTPAFDTQFFTPDIRFDVHYMQDFNGPKDHTIVGSTEEFRSGEFQLEQISLGGDFHWDNVRARFLSMSDCFRPLHRETTPAPRWDNGIWAMRIGISPRPNAGYHFDVSHGLNIDAGIFVFVHRLVQLLQFR